MDQSVVSIQHMLGQLDVLGDWGGYKVNMMNS